MGDDHSFARWVRTTLQELGLEHEAVRAIERQIRAEFGGTRHYISKRATANAPESPGRGAAAKRGNPPALVFIGERAHDLRISAPPFGQIKVNEFFASVRGVPFWNNVGDRTAKYPFADEPIHSN
jgi:hypothetical protein